MYTEFGIPKAIVVVLVLIAANILWAYIRRLQRRAEANEAFRKQSPPPSRKNSPSDDRLGEYVDYEEIKD